jgi:iron complex transport system ATP-binding protein
MYRAERVSLSIRGTAILDRVELDLSRGKVVAVIGPNGAGKSTLLKMMAGELRPDSGTVKLDDRPLAEYLPAQLAARRAVLPQSVDVVFPYRVSQIVSLGLPGGRTVDDAEAILGRALDAVEMRGFAARVYRTLSGGEKQRVQLARVLAQIWSRGGTYLLLDEPTASLDLAHQLLILRIARAHATDRGGVLMVLHDLNLACMAADEIVALKDGRRIAAGPPQDVITDELVAQLYGLAAQVRGVPDGPFLLPQTAQPRRHAR